MASVSSLTERISPAPLAAVDMVAAVGSRVRVCGLVSVRASAFNGKAGTVASCELSKGRVAVTLDDGDTLSLKLENIRIEGGTKTPGATMVDAAPVVARLPNPESTMPDATPSSVRPPPRFPAWIVATAADGGLHVPELRGTGPEIEVEAARLVACSQPFVWRQAALGPALPSILGRVNELGSQVLDTNVCRRRDRKFVYFAPDRLQRGIYEPSVVRKQFAPMSLNEQISLEDTLRRVAAVASCDTGAGGEALHGCDDRGDDCDVTNRDDSTEGAIRTDGSSSKKFSDRSHPSAASRGAAIGSAVGDGGWMLGDSFSPNEGVPYVMHKLLECATAKEAAMLADRGNKIPANVRPGIAKLAGLQGDQYALWTAGLGNLARSVVDETDWRRVGALARSGGWGVFEQAGLMVSARDSLTPTHYDGHHNVFLQVAGAKRFLLFPPEQSPQLYGFPALHPLDPLSRVDLELPESELRKRWPRARESARGASVVVEAGDVLVMPQAVWHQVHSLDACNISINLLFAVDPAERACGAAAAAQQSAPCGPLPLPPVIADLTAPRRAAALSELAKYIEVLVARMVGPVHVAHALASVGDGDGKSDDAVVIRQLLSRSLTAPKDGESLPSVREFARHYLDPARFRGLPLRS